MRSRARAVWAVQAVALLIAVGAAPASARPAPAPCSAADALVRAGEKPAARKLYVALLKSRPGLRCASTGLADLNASTDAADAVSLCARAAILRSAHRNDDAADLYKQALEKDPQNTCSSKGLHALDASWASRAASSLAGALPDVLLAAGLLLVGALLLLMAGHIPPIGRMYGRWWGVRALLRPRMSLDDLDDSGLDDGKKVGKAMTARIREQLQRFREEALDPTGVAYSLDFGTGHQELADIVSGDGQLRSSLGRLGDASDHTKIVAAIVDALIAALPIARLSVGGVVEPAASAPSATLALQSGPRLTAAATITGNATAAAPDAGDYLRLCPAAAVWVQYEVARALARHELPSEGAESYALVRTGLDLHDAQRDPEAIAAFERALELDPCNWAARVNLAVVQARNAAFDDAVAILEEALEDIENRADQ